MSKGHASPAMYSILHQMGVLNEDDIMGFRTLGSVCQGHVDMNWTKGGGFLCRKSGNGFVIRSRVRSFRQNGFK